MSDSRLPQQSVAHAPVVLLVEDDDSNREMYALCLELAGYWVVNARNGAEALISARTCKPQVVVTDLSMPGMGGLELARALREDDSTKSIRIIAVSGRPRDAELERHLQKRHVDRLLTKPCLPDELIDEIHRVLTPRAERGAGGTSRILDRSHDRTRRARRQRRRA